MFKPITLAQALELVSFQQYDNGDWQVLDVRSHINGDVDGHVYGTINGRRWQSVETPKEKLRRLLDEVSEKELLKLINQLEDN